MKRFSRLFSMLILIALIAVPSLTAFAQDGANPLCQGLSEDDCALMTASDAAMAGVTSFSTPNWSISFTITLPADTGMEGDTAAEPAMQTVSFDAMGSGAFSMDPASDVVLHLMIDEANVSDGETSQSGSAEVIVTQEMAYVNYEGEWYGGTLEEGGIDISQLYSLGDTVDMSALDTAGIDLTGALTTTRSDAEMMGQGMAAFNTEINVTQLIIAALSSPAAGEMLGEGMGGEAMSPEDMQMIGMFLQPMLTGTTLTAERWVGQDDNYIHKLALDLVLALDLSMLAPEIGKIDGELHFMSELGNFNEAVSASIPESYKPMEELGQGLDLGELESGLSGLGM